MNKWCLFCGPRHRSLAKCIEMFVSLNVSQAQYLLKKLVLHVAIARSQGGRDRRDRRRARLARQHRSCWPQAVHICMTWVCGLRTALLCWWCGDECVRFCRVLFACKTWCIHIGGLIRFSLSSASASCTSRLIPLDRWAPNSDAKHPVVSGSLCVCVFIQHQTIFVRSVVCLKPPVTSLIRRDVRVRQTDGLRQTWTLCRRRWTYAWKQHAVQLCVPCVWLCRSVCRCACRRFVYQHVRVSRNSIVTKLPSRNCGQEYITHVRAKSLSLMASPDCDDGVSVVFSPRTRLVVCVVYSHYSMIWLSYCIEFIST